MRDLGVSETLAAVLVRRGYADVERARSFLDGGGARARSVPARRHGGGLRGDPRAPSPKGSGSACTATTTRTGSARPRSPCSFCASSAPTSRSTCRAASTRATALARDTLTRLAGEGVGLVLTVDCGVTAVEEVAHARDARARGGDHRPPPLRAGAAGVPGRRALPRRVPVHASSAAPGSSGSSGRRCSAPDSEALAAAPRPRRGRHRRRRRAARWTRTAASPSPGCGSWRARRSPACRS